jgi:hypothetical protein
LQEAEQERPVGTGGSVPLFVPFCLRELTNLQDLSIRHGSALAKAALQIDLRRNTGSLFSFPRSAWKCHARRSASTAARSV